MVIFSEDRILETRIRGQIEVICDSILSEKAEELIRSLKYEHLCRECYARAIRESSE